MNIKKAKEVLATNVLDLSMAGMDLMPMKTVKIQTFEIMNKSKANPNEQTTWYEKAHLLGLVDENQKEGLICYSFVVKLWHDHYYREFFSGAMEVIEALRTVNEYNSPDDESITITFP